jgi:hypothetical protein
VPAGVANVDASQRARITSRVAEVPNAATPYFVPVHIGVREARRYFAHELEVDRCEADQIPPVKRGAPTATGDATHGKSEIFIHKGEVTKNGSFGCQVSPAFAALRQAMIEYHLESDGWFYAEFPDDFRFAREVHWEREPTLFPEHTERVARLAALTRELNATVDPMIGIIDKVLARQVSGKLTRLKGEIAVLQRQVDARSNAPDAPARQEVLDNLQAIVDAAADEDIVALLEAEKAQRTTEWQERTSELRAQLAAVQREIDDFGWNDAMHGDYWVIRPDERAS